MLRVGPVYSKGQAELHNSPVERSQELVCWELHLPRVQKGLLLGQHALGDKAEGGAEARIRRSEHSVL